MSAIKKNKSEGCYRFIDLFAGIGGFRIAFERLRQRCVFSSEIDATAQATYQANFGERPEGDITKIPACSVPDHDILLAGFPCQSFSIMGKMLGFVDTRGTLFFDIERILKAKRPSFFLLENVPQLVTNQSGRAFKEILCRLKQLGYHVRWAVLNALHFGLPQKRQRVYIAGFDNNYKFEFPEGSAKYDLGSVLEPDSEVREKYQASDAIRRKRLAAVRPEDIFYPSVWHENKAGNVSLHNHSCALRANASYNYQLVNGTRRFTPREMLRLQGFPEEFELRGSYQQIRAQTGNAVPVPVVQAIGEAMLETINSRRTIPNDIVENGQLLLLPEKK